MSVVEEVIVVVVTKDQETVKGSRVETVVTQLSSPYRSLDHPGKAVGDSEWRELLFSSSTQVSPKVL